MAITVYINATILGHRQKDATISKSMGRFGPGLDIPGCFGLILVWVDSALTVSRLDTE